MSLSFLYDYFLPFCHFFSALLFCWVLNSPTVSVLGLICSLQPSSTCLVKLGTLEFNTLCLGFQ